MKRSDFNSASEYIEEYQKQYYMLARFKAGPHPAYTLSQVLQNLESEIQKVQFISEEVARLEPRKMTLKKVEEYWRGLQAVADMDGVTNAAYHVGRGRSRGGNRGSGYNSGSGNDMT